MPYPGDVSKFALFQQLLIGRWANKTYGTDEEGHGVGGEDNPLSYNIMPLPQIPAQEDQPNYPGYILKNFRYYENIEFKNKDEIPIPALAPNRGGRFNQSPRALFYDQQVKFAEGPSEDIVVHVENGSWLYLSRDPQQIGPYDTGDIIPGKIEPEPPELTVAKQISVPHGNSVLAFGSFDEYPQEGAPNIEDADSPYPEPAYISVEPYATKRTDLDNYQNPNTDFTEDPNQPLQLGIDIIDPDAYLHWNVTTKPVGKDEKGMVTNIPFEQRLAKITAYNADYWLLSTDDGDSFNHIAYRQIMDMDMIISGRKYSFPHVTCNIITREQIDVNTAGARGLEKLPDIGPDRSQYIIEYRNEHGPFHSTDELLQVEGIGQKIIARIKHMITYEPE
jgi:competence ComEA-like helix-hairpin-helix protein